MPPSGNAPAIPLVDHYSVLQLPRTASAADIKAAYHAAARLHHPDKQQQQQQAQPSQHDTTALFVPIQAAWECLSNPSHRQAYDLAWDRIHKERESRRRNAVPVTWGDCRYATGGAANEEDDVVLYTCRCGQQIDLCEQEPEEEDDDIVSCPSCSLLYDVSRIITSSTADVG